MTGTFITQRQFDDIDACMAFIETTPGIVGEFASAAELGNKFGVTRPPTTEMREGASQARFWKLKTDPGFYRLMTGHLKEVASFTQYIDSYIPTLSAVEKRGPVSRLSGLVVPAYLYPATGTEPIKNCLQLLQYHQRWVCVFSEISRVSTSGHQEVRQGIYKVLPRVFDFMSVHLHHANAKCPKPPRIESARKLLHTTRYHYFAGMGATANFLTQHERINYLLAKASESFAGMEKVATLARLATGMKLIMVELDEVQRLGKEIVVLRTGE